MHHDPLRPSEYTAALLRQLRLRGPCTGRVLEMGCGGGTVLAALAAAGAHMAVGVDVEPEAVRRTQALLESLGATRFALHRGDLWQPLAGERFDLVVFNPPQLPLQDGATDGDRLRSWSAGGRDGRAVLDRFLQELDAHLAPGGAALITHSSFLDLDRTRRLLAARGLGTAVLQTVCVRLAPYKLHALSPRWLQEQAAGALHCVGPYVFTDFHVVEIRHADAAQPD